MRLSGEDSSPGFSAAANPLVGDAGPAFDPDQAAQAPPVATPLQLADVQWEPGRFRTILRAQGLLTHEWVGVGTEDWVWRESELAAISEPLANVANKFPVTRAAAAVSDELTIGAVAFEYAFRSMKERSKILRAIKAAEEAEQARYQAGPVRAGSRAFSTGVSPDPSENASPVEHNGVDWHVPEVP